MTDSGNPSVRLDPADNVVTAIRPLAAVTEVAGVATTALIPRGHKIATAAIADGAPVLKYAQVIGYAAGDIRPGEVTKSGAQGGLADFEFVPWQIGAVM